MYLYLLRHGVAAARDPALFQDDSLRPLTRRGEERVQEISRAIQRMDLGIEAIWSSPYLRTRQTAETAAKALGLENRLHLKQELSPEGDQRKLLAKIQSTMPGPNSLLLVGHEPYLSRLLSVLVTGSSRLNVEFRKGGLTELETTSPIGTHRCAVLRWLIQPRLLVRIGR